MRLAIVWIGWLTCAAMAADVTVIANATVVDGTGAPPRIATVVIEGDRIKTIAGVTAVPPGATVIDARGKTLLPGLFDLHTHLLASGGPLIADWGKMLKTYLLNGVTTVADMGTNPEQFAPMRKLIAGGLAAPHVLMAGRFSTPGGHGAEQGRGDFHTQEVQTPREARSAVRLFAAYRPDVLKVFTDGWRYGIETDMTSMDEATLTALVGEAHKLGLKVVTHTVSLEKAKIAARAGVDVINHGIGDAPLDEEALRLMKAKGTGYVQTLAVYEPRPGSKSAPRAKRWTILMQNGKLAQQAGVVMGAGTDAGVTGTFHGSATLRELELMVQGGMSPVQAISAATGNSAKLLGVEKDRGTIEVGKLADLVLIDGNPAERIRDIRKVSRVWLGGQEQDRAELAAAIASPEMTPVTALPASTLLDDFESTNGRSRVDTLWINNTDGGSAHARMSYQRTLRQDGGHALTVLSEMSDEERPSASMVLPLSAGGVLPVDASAFLGVEFETRGEGAFVLEVQTRAVMDRRFFRSGFAAAAEWRTIRIPFAELKRPGSGNAAQWTGADLLALEFGIVQKARKKAWLELDNVRFYVK